MAIAREELLAMMLQHFVFAVASSFFCIFFFGEVYVMIDLIVCCLYLFEVSLIALSMPSLNVLTGMSVSFPMQGQKLLCALASSLWEQYLKNANSH